MKRSLYYNYIHEKMHVLANRIISNGKLNLLDLHSHSENFYLYFFNLLFDYNLENLNKSLQNVEAIDLVDNTNKIVIQVSSTNTKAKVESALTKDIIKKYNNYTFKFISIAKDASNLRKGDFKNPHSIFFDPMDDIYDISTILKIVNAFDIDKLKGIYSFIKKELGNEIDILKLDSNLAQVINILAKEKWGKADDPNKINKFEIERKIEHNELDSAKYIVEEYSVYHMNVEKKYSEFDSFGNNKSRSVLATFKREYLKVKKNENADEVFFGVIEVIKNKIINSANFVEIPIDELELCVDILTVDAFIRCKIFENPEGYNYVAT